VLVYDHLLVGTDGSPTATRAVEAAARLAHAYNAKLTIAHAFRGRPIPVADAHLMPAGDLWKLSPGATAESVVAEAADRAQLAACGGLEIATRIEPGTPAHVLRTLARELRPDAVVVGNADAQGMHLRRPIGHVLTRRLATDVVIIDTVALDEDAA
jgi:nucleotide-binding universal stress UspA family protein